MIRSRRTPLPVQDCCRLLGVSRASVYRKASGRFRAEDPELERLAGEHPRFGYRRLAALTNASPKKTRLAMSRLGLMAKRKPRRVRTTFPVPVDAANLCRIPQAPGELLVSDFTYIGLASGNAFLAITLDVFTRRVRGWALSRSMATDFTLSALRMAIDSGPLAEGWVHHSDRGSQYASAAFRDVVRSQSGASSFSRPASPGDNAYAESFFARFKDEVVRTNETLTYEQAAADVHSYIQFYNESRPHSSLGNLSPMTYERQLAEKPLGVCVS